MKRKVLCAAVTGLLGLGLVTESRAQGVLFDQYHQVPLATNPANPAMSNAMSVTVGYHSNKVATNQGLNSLNLSVLYPIFRTNRGDTTRTGYAGFYFLNDNTKMAGAAGLIGGAVSYGHNIPISSAGDKLSLGLQLGYFQKSLKIDKYTASNQFNTTTGNFESGVLPDIPGNGGTNPTASNLIVNAGINYYREDDETGFIKHYLGVATMNLNQPNFSFLKDQKDPVKLAIATTGGVAVLNNDQFIITPNFRNYFVSSSQMQTNIGSLFHYKISEGSMAGGNVGIGGWYSSYGGLKPTGAIVSVEANMPNFVIALAYNFAVNDLTTEVAKANQQEIVVGFRKVIGRNRSKPAAYTPAPPAPVVVDTVVRRPTPPPAPVEPKPEPIPEPKPEPVAPAPKPEPAPAPAPEPKKVVPAKPKAKPKAAAKKKVTKKKAAAATAKTAKAVSKAQAKKDKGLKLTAAERKLLGEIPLYGFNSTELNSRDKEILDSISILMAAKPELKLQIDGHADKIGSDAVNFRIAQARADAAVDYMVNKGISASRLTTKSYGKTKPRDTNETEEGRARNRRVEFTVIH